MRKRARMPFFRSQTRLVCWRGPGQNKESDNAQAFDSLAQESRVSRTARMLDEGETLSAGQRTDIVERFRRFIEEYRYTQAQAACEMGIGNRTVADTLRLPWQGRATDRHLVRLHNRMELAARRENLIRKRHFVEHSVAADILHLAAIVAETCKIGVVFGPAQMGKTMTLRAIEGDHRFGDPVLFRTDETLLRPCALCRVIAERFELSTRGTADRVFRRVVTRLAGIKRMLMFDEVERCHYRALWFLRDLHDETGCPLPLCGKPAIYEKLGFRSVADFSEVTDQLAARIVIRRDLTERTRACNPRPPFILEDIRKLIHTGDLKLHVGPDAVKWLQMRASSLGTGGPGNALACFYLAYKLAFAQSLEAITTETLEAVADLTMGYEDAQRVAEVVAESSIASVIPRVV